jgi:CubicO group peptidase (beta-lactamase class C family)
MREALQSWQVPGAALAIVHQDRPIYLKGFGVRALGKKEPVTPDTVFPLASCTKPFTSLALAMLVDEGKVHWDDPVRKHVPFFRLADPLADAQVTLRDLLTHRTGLSGHDLLWYRSPWTLEERIRKVGLLQPAESFRTAFQYQSILYGTAGYAAAQASGDSWQALVQRRIFDSLGMKSATCSTKEALTSADHASPHRRSKDGKREMIPWYRITEPDPAGSINAWAGSCRIIAAGTCSCMAAASTASAPTSPSSRGSSSALRCSTTLIARR